MLRSESRRSQWGSEKWERFEMVVLYLPKGRSVLVSLAPFVRKRGLCECPELALRLSLEAVGVGS